MASPLGHLAAGAGIAWLARDGDATAGGRDQSLTLLVVAAALWALLPDFDFLPGLVVGAPARFHQGASHSLLFALAAGLVGMLVVRIDGLSPRRIFAVLTTAVASHLALDYFVLDRRPPSGLPLLWPFSDERFISPVPLLLGVQHAQSADDSIAVWLGAILSRDNVYSLALEVAWVLALLAAGRLAVRPRTSEDPG